MCDDSLTRVPPPRQELSPEVKLNNLLARELKVCIPPGELRMFLRYHWKEVAKLAHQIHDAP